MKIRSVSANSRSRNVEVRTAAKALSYPFAKLDPTPGPGDRIREIFVDEEIAREGFSYVLESGRGGTIHVEQVLEYNRDPGFLRDALLYRLTLEAAKRIEASPVARREIVRRLGTSAAQLYRLLDPRNLRKSVDQMLRLLAVLECEVDLVVRARRAGTGSGAARPAR